MLSTLECILQTMSDKDRMYSLMFDENVHFIQKSGCIEGNENLGSHSRTSNIASHALVLCSMVSVKVEANIICYLIQGSTKSEMLVNFLLEVLDACQNAGLEVVATACDMGANKLLGVSETTLSSDFRIEKLWLYLILPYLLKCTSNLFLKHDVENEKCEITVNGE